MAGDTDDYNAMDWYCLANLNKAGAVDYMELVMDTEILLQNLDDVLLAVDLVDDIRIAVAEDLNDNETFFVWIRTDAIAFGLVCLTLIRLPCGYCVGGAFGKGPEGACEAGGACAPLC